MQGFEEAAALGDFTADGAVAALLGGPKVLNRTPKGPVETHELLMEGLPSKALTYLIDHLLVLERTPSLEKAIGMSLRTFQRRKDAPDKALTIEQGGRVWKFAEILAETITVFGTRELAERWLDRPAMGLDGRRPIDLLATPAGVHMVEQFLGRLKYGVYT